MSQNVLLIRLYSKERNKEDVFMKRKIFRVSILFALLFCLSTTVFAEDVEVGMEDDIGAATIMTTNIGKIVKKFSISN